MTRRVPVALLELGGMLVLVGLTGAVVFQVQPWRTCPDDTVPAACPMLPGDYDTFVAFTAVLLVGCLILLAAGVLRMARDVSKHR